MISLETILILAGILFCLGAACTVLRKNILMILIGVEIMLNAAGLAFAGGSLHWGRPEGQIFVLFIMAAAGAEVAVGLALVVHLERRRRSVGVDDYTELGGRGMDEKKDEEERETA